jgi:glycosyltransferase involved in cell wall biosynthesis
MPRKVETQIAEQPVILFFGSLDSAANVDGASFLLDEVLPRVEPVLRRHQVRIHLAGKNPPAALREKVARIGGDLVVLVGAVESMERAIGEARMVLLPLRIASGTRTRILEAAAVGKAVVTTALGAEGLGLGSDEVCLAEDGAGLAGWVGRLLEKPELAAGFGRRLQAKCWELYRPDRVAADVVREIAEFAKR